MSSGKWVRVAFPADYLPRKEVLGLYCRLCQAGESDCACPRPDLNDEYAYKFCSGVMYARRKPSE